LLTICMMCVSVYADNNYVEGIEILAVTTWCRSEDKRVCWRSGYDFAASLKISESNLPLAAGDTFIVAEYFLYPVQETPSRELEWSDIRANALRFPNTKEDVFTYFGLYQEASGTVKLGKAAAPGNYYLGIVLNLLELDNVPVVLTSKKTLVEIVDGRKRAELVPSIFNPVKEDLVESAGAYFETLNSLPPNERNQYAVAGEQSQNELLSLLKAQHKRSERTIQDSYNELRDHGKALWDADYDHIDHTIKGNPGPSAGLTQVRGTTFKEHSHEGGSCYLCMEDFQDGEKIEVSQCKHIQNHPYCLGVQSTCPMCREPLEYIGNKEFPQEHADLASVHEDQGKSTSLSGNERSDPESAESGNNEDSHNDQRPIVIVRPNPRDSRRRKFRDRFSCCTAPRVVE
jgi:hypothetical protein